MTKNELLYGFTGPLPAQRLLMAGPFSMVYENGFIRHIRYGRAEIVRMIYMALRDKNWGTYSPVIENETINAGTDAFDIQYRCSYKEGTIKLFSWDVSISGDQTGKILFSIKGMAHNDLLVNRAGFCILHPVKETVGERLTLTHPDGTTEEGLFPEFIAPHNPFLSISRMQWSHQSREYMIAMKGDVFETEDQRNWTDASFKTFCTPLSLPFPVLLKKDQRIEQEVVFGPVARLPLIEALPDRSHISITICEDQIIKMPAIGVGASTESLHPADTAVMTGKINFDYYCIEIRLHQDGWREHLSRELNFARTLDSSLYIRVELSAEHRAFVNAFVEMIAAFEGKISYLLLIELEAHVTSQQTIDWVNKNVKAILPGVLLGIGTAGNFAELNRNRKTINHMDFVSYAIHPQEHAFDHLTMIENLAAQADTVASARQIYPGKAICISPVTLRKTVNPYAQNSADRLPTNKQRADPRQASLWNAGWTLGSIKNLSEAGADAITYFQTTGGQGIADQGGKLYPCGMVLQLLLQGKDTSIVKTNTSDPLRCSSLLQEAGGKRTLFLANHTGNVIHVKLPFNITGVARVQPYPSWTKESQVKETDEITLQPWAVVSVS